MTWKSILLILFVVCTKASGYKILAFYGFASKSHLNALNPVINELAERGHKLTLIQPYPELKFNSKIKVMPSFDMGPIKEEEGKIFFEDTGIMPPMISFILGFGIWGEEACRNMLETDSVKSLLNKGKQFDIVIVNYILCECGIAISPLLGNYTVYYSAGFIPHFYPSPAPVPYAAIPNHMSPLPLKMTFMQRITNVANFIINDVGYYYYYLPKADKVLKELVPQAPSTKTAMNQISLYITNTDPVIGIPRPSVPNIVSLCCPHCRNAKPLPQELEKFIATAGEHGFIIFGLGSSAQSKFFPQSTKEALLSAFGKLKQNVIWKFEDDSIKPPPNVFLTKWMPQQDLLGHPKLRLFITHGGLLSLQEAVYNGVPIIGIPIFADQPGNVAYMVEKGLAGQLHLNNITSEGVYEEIMKVLHPSYQEKMRKQSVLLKEHNKGTVKDGADWIEYVARHDGAWHLRTRGQDMNRFQYLLLDIIIFLTGIGVSLAIVSVIGIQFICRKLRQKKVKKAKLL